MTRTQGSDNIITTLEQQHFQVPPGDLREAVVPRALPPSVISVLALPFRPRLTAAGSVIVRPGVNSIRGLRNSRSIALAAETEHAGHIETVMSSLHMCLNSLSLGTLDDWSIRIRLV